ncbi:MULTISPECIES: arylesterase [Thioalkalivibrio]|uniref:Arylesterase n=1 Tax=Thioalkalivibrio halophilus TaxID=252474 RepID=A0A1V2ZXW7_9GAMM|nr:MULTISPECIES: arylesterase [Thioalkalivibrio]OOC09906.1 arylesterase [Thioalkalivibrio halophilus]
MLRFPFIVVGLFALLLSLPLAANSPEETNSSASVDGENGAHPLLVFGDSLSTAWGMDESEGWVALLEERLADRDAAWEVHNASISGETTAGGRQRLPDNLERTEPDLVILELGGNDGLRGLSPAAMRDNLEAMLDAIDAAGAETLLLGIRIPPNYGPQYTDRFEAVFRDLAEERELAFEPFFLDGIADDDVMMHDDGIHPSAEAQPQLLDNLWPSLKPVLERVEREERQ